MRNNCHSLSSLCVMFGQVTVLALLLISGHRSSADSAVSETVSSPDSASSPLSPSSSLSSSSRQKRAPGWGKRNGLEGLDDDEELDGDGVYSAWDNNDMTDKRAPGWGKRAPGWGKRAPGWTKRAPGWGKRAPGWGKRSLDAENVLEDDEDTEKRAPGWGKRGWAKSSPIENKSYRVVAQREAEEEEKRAPGWGKRAPGWGKRAPGWGKRAPGWGKRAPGWGKRAPGWGKRASGDVCDKLSERAKWHKLKAFKIAEDWVQFCGNSEETNELDRK